ncbi:hypothetical protein GWI33_023303, partial [Rhynchophorus ferrugineus]
PIDETSTAFVDILDEPPVFSDEEEETPANETEQPEAVGSLEIMEETPKAPEETQVTVTTEKKVEYKGLPIDETSTAFVDILDEPPVFSGVEEETPAKETEQPEVVVSLETMEETPKVTEETQVTVITEKKVEYKGLPIDETSTAFVDILDEPPVFSDEEEETPANETEQPEAVGSLEIMEETPKAPEETQVTVTTEKKVEYKGLPIDETSTAFVDILDEPPVFSGVEEETPAKETEQPEVVVSLETMEETPKVTEETQVTVITEKKVEYKGLPIDETSTAFVDILDEPPVFSDEEEETPANETEQPEAVGSLEIMEETPKAPEETQVTVTTEKKVEYKGLPIDETSTAFVDILDEPPVFSGVEEETPAKETEQPEVVVSLETMEETPKVTEETQVTVITEKKVEYKGLPIDETSTAFVDILDEP